VARPAFNPLLPVHAFRTGNDEKIKDRRVCLGGGERYGRSGGKKGISSCA